MSHIMGITFRSMNISQLVIWFFIYSFLGWCMECVVIRKQLGYWENRGFAKLPFCVIYGFGTLIAFNIFKAISSKIKSCTTLLSARAPNSGEKPSFIMSSLAESVVFIDMFLSRSFLSMSSTCKSKIL